MSATKTPLVLDSKIGGPGQLQPSDDLDIPLRGRVEILEQNQRLLIQALLIHDIVLPDQLTENL